MAELPVSQTERSMKRLLRDCGQELSVSAPPDGPDTCCPPARQPSLWLPGQHGTPPPSPNGASLAGRRGSHQCPRMPNVRREVHRTRLALRLTWPSRPTISTKA